MTEHSFVNVGNRRNRSESTVRNCWKRWPGEERKRRAKRCRKRRATNVKNTQIISTSYFQKKEGFLHMKCLP